MSNEKIYYRLNHNKKLVTTHFDCITDVMEFDPRGTTNETLFLKYTDKNGTQSADRKQYGTTNDGLIRNVWKHALLGDHELVKILYGKIESLKKAVNKESKDYTQQIQVSRRRRIKAGNGDELDIHKVFQGNIDTAWSKTIRETVDRSHNLITLFVDCGGIWVESLEDSLWRAAVSFVLYEDLMRAGKTVRIIVGSSSVGTFRRYPGYVSSWSVTVKNYNEQLAPERLAAMSHLGFFRTCGFAIKATAPILANWGLGRSINAKESGIVPENIQEEIDAGHTRLIHLGKSMNLKGAISNLSDCYAQMDKYSKNSKN